MNNEEIMTGVELEIILKAEKYYLAVAPKSVVQKIL